MSPTVQKLKSPMPNSPCRPLPFAVGLEAPLDRIADVRGHVLEVRESLVIARHPIPVILDGEVVGAVFLAARDGDGFRVRIDRVLDEFCDRLQGIALRERDDPDCVPIVADPQLPAVLRFRFHPGTGIRWR